MRDCYDVAVVGAGIVGVSTALHLLMRGKKVLLIDRGGAGQETSFCNSGIIETSYVLPFSPPSYKHMARILLDTDTAVRFHYSSLPHYLGWIADFYLKSRIDIRRNNGKLLRPLIACALDEHRALMRGTEAERHLSATGRVKLHRSEASFAGAALERRVAQELGVSFEVMDAAAFHEIEPFVRPVYHKAVKWTSSARLTNPCAVTAAYAEKFAREGGIFQKTGVRALTHISEDLWNVETEQGAVQANQVVVCAGPWSSDLYKSLGYAFPLGVKRGYCRHFSAIGAATLAHAVVDTDIGYVIGSMEQGIRITTGAEFADRDAPPTPVQIERVLPYARELFPLGEAKESQARLGNRPCFADSLPVIGATPRHKGLWFNFGHGHSGLTIGPSSGRLLAEMFCGEVPFCDPTPYRADRFA